MGIETTPDVEESTEPPICASTESTLSSPAAAVRPNHKQRETDEKQPTTLQASHNQRSNHHRYNSPELPDGPGRDVENAHLLEPSNLAVLLQTDLQCVVTRCYLEDLS